MNQFFFHFSFHSQDGEKVYKDPLRELILLSENRSAKIDEQYATNLAKQASVLSNVKEIHIDANSATTKPVQKPVTKVTPPPIPKEANASLSAVFQDKKDIVDPIKEREFLIKLNAMEESDTECVTNVEKPILGKVSLMRRAKSAVSRSIIERRINDKHPLFTVSSEKEKTSSTNTESTPKAGSHIIIDMNVDDDVNASDDDIPTPEEVKRHMELFHLRHGQPPASAKLDENRKSKHSKSRSARPTKSNRLMCTNYVLSVCGFLIFLFSKFCFVTQSRTI